MSRRQANQPVDSRRYPRERILMQPKRRWLRLLLLPTAVLLTVSCAASPTPPAGDAAAIVVDRALLPDVGGRVDVAVISVNSARRAALRNALLVTNIVNGLAPSTTFFVLSNDPTAFSVAGGDWPDRVHLVELPFDNPITIWPQDPFLVLKGGAGGSQTTLLTSRGFERAGDRLMAEKIADQAGYALEASSLFFEGGNIVSDEQSILIGANTIRRNATELGLSEVDVVLAFQQELGRRVLVVGPYPQPVAHIDMILTPLGNKEILLADAMAGIEVAEQALEDDSDSVTAFERYCEENFFGHPTIRTIPGKDGQTTSAPEVRGKTREMIEISRLVAPVLDGIAAALERMDYRVERVPFLFGGPESRDPGEAETSTRAAYPMLTYNNVLIEAKGEERVVYLPRYGWPAMDEAASRVWQDQGFSPRAIDGLTISAMYGGALRCAVKVLER